LGKFVHNIKKVHSFEGYNYSFFYYYFLFDNSSHFLFIYEKTITDGKKSIRTHTHRTCATVIAVGVLGETILAIAVNHTREAPILFLLKKIKNIHHHPPLTTLPFPGLPFTQPNPVHRQSPPRAHANNDNHDPTKKKALLHPSLPMMVMMILLPLSPSPRNQKVPRIVNEK